jgi:xylan 1,4-beta-xylosidase
MSRPGDERTYTNPILPGFHPDPSICRVGDDYFLVTSTFEYFPGLPLHHSRDLVHWRPIGHVLDRPSQLPLDGVRPSGGLYAPAIRHHDGRFYLTCTLVDGTAGSGHFVVTAEDPAGPWSEPVWLPGAGIDPSPFVDDDGTAWFVANRPVTQPRFRGHTEIWLRRFDLDALSLVGDEHVLWDGALEGGVWSEGPHLFRRGPWYYLVTAEGGTHLDHAVMVARSREVTGPYESCPWNPALTHRHLGRHHPVAAVGHSDLVETQHGDWWAVMLAIRLAGGIHHNLGRETFLAPVVWEDDWPVLAPGEGHLPEQVADHVQSPHMLRYWRQRWGQTATPLLWSHAMHLVLLDELGRLPAR